MFTRERDVCRACEPYSPSDVERRWVRIWISNWILFTICGVLWLIQDDASPFVLIMGQALFLGGILVTAWHEAAHALTTRLLGGHAPAIYIGRGPPLARWRIGTSEVIIGRYVFLGGLAHNVWIGQPERWKVITLIASAPLANLGAAILLFWGVSLLTDDHEALAAALAGHGLGHLVAGFVNLWPSRAADGEPDSDGRQIWRLLTERRAAHEPYLELCTDAHKLSDLGRFREAVEAAERAWTLKPDRATAPALLLHALGQAEGPDAAVACYNARREAFAVAEAAEDSAYLLVNIADAALRARAGCDLALAEHYAGRALQAVPDAPPMLGTQGLLLIARGQRAAGEVLLLQALRGSSSREDRAQFAALLAEAAERAGDVAVAEAFSDIARRHRPPSSGSARA